MTLPNRLKTVELEKSQCRSRLLNGGLAVVERETDDWTKYARRLDPNLMGAVVRQLAVKAENMIDFNQTKPSQGPTIDNP